MKFKDIRLSEIDAMMLAKDMDIDQAEANTKN